VSYARERTGFGRRIIDHQGLGFVLADTAAAVDCARAAYLDAARRRDAGLPYSRHASVAKLIASDTAMRVTTDAVQVFGGYGYTRDYRVERYMREAQITQIFEGTNQIQRLVISRHWQRAEPFSTPSLPRRRGARSADEREAARRSRFADETRCATTASRCATRLPDADRSPQQSSALFRRASP
jgi:hypothetical protein